MLDNPFGLLPPGGIPTAPVIVMPEMDHVTFALWFQRKVHMGRPLFEAYKKAEATGGETFWNWLEATETFELDTPAIKPIIDLE